MSFALLQEKIIEKKAPIVAGLDGRIEYVPPHIREASYAKHGKTIAGACDALLTFNQQLIDVFAEIVPAVKPQAAYYENLGPQGVEMLEKTIQYAKSKGLYVIADIKRGDIGATASAYAEGWLGETIIESQPFRTFDANCVTLNGYMGLDAIQPFLDFCNNGQRTAFILVRTSNKSASELQDLLMADGRPLYRVMGDLVEQWSQGTKDSSGYNALGAVVGATNIDQMIDLRAHMKDTFFLVPGYGAQGGTAADVKHAFQEGGRGAIINSSRGLMCAWQKSGNNGVDFQEATRNATLLMQKELLQHLSY
ncbi:MAG: orotidine-5'-phosphate decarboxylase [Eubacteriales bacterium]